MYLVSTQESILSEEITQRTHIILPFSVCFCILYVSFCCTLLIRSKYDLENVHCKAEDTMNQYKLVHAKLQNADIKAVQNTICFLLLISTNKNRKFTCEVGINLTQLLMSFILLWLFSNFQNFLFVDTCWLHNISYMWYDYKNYYYT